MFSALSKLIPRGISLRFSLWFALLFTVFSLSCLVLAYTFVASSLRERDQRLIIEKHHELSPFVSGRDVSELAQKIKSEANGDESEFFIRVSTIDGTPLYIDTAFDDLDEFKKIPLPGTAGTSKAGGLWNELLSDEGDEFLELYSAKLPSGDWLEVGHSSEDREDLLTGFRDQMPWAAISLLLGGLVCGVAFSNRALRPIRDLIATVSNIKSGNLSARVQTSSTGDELDKLKRLFNEMLDQIEALINSLKQTTDGLAHDIKTPITRLRADAELALAEGASESQLRDALATTIENSEQIILIVDSLMDVSEAEAGSMHLNIADIDVDDVISNVLDLYDFVALERTIELIHNKTGTPQKLRVKGDVVQLRRALANLIDNAIKYADPGSRITVTSSASSYGVAIAVSDTGRGIPAHELPHIWSRLFRGDQSRSEKGMGLGLSLVKAIVEAHGGKVDVQSTVGKGSIFTLELPGIHAT